MTPLPRPDNRLYLGRGGSGKTTLALDHAQAFRRVLLVRPDDAEAPPYPWTRDRRLLVETMLQPAWRVTFIVDGQVEQWEWANEAASAAGDCLVIWEEAHTLMAGKRLQSFAPFAFDLWMKGRHRRCRIFACSIRPASLSPDVRANLARACVFHTIEGADLDWYRRSLGLAPEAVRGLKPFEAIDWRPDGADPAVKRSPFA